VYALAHMSRHASSETTPIVDADTLPRRRIQRHDVPPRSARRRLFISEPF
jgi:hypothetical protein